MVLISLVLTYSTDGTIGIKSEGTVIGSGITQIDFASSNGSGIAVDIPPATARSCNGNSHNWYLYRSRYRPWRLINISNT